MAEYRTREGSVPEDKYEPPSTSRDGGLKYLNVYLVLKINMKPRPSKFTEWDIRLTPFTQVDVPTTEWARLTSTDKDERLLVCREGGTTELKLHYHIYYKSTMSKSQIYNILRSIAGSSGNKGYKVKLAHDKSIGYIVKNHDVVYRHNYTDTHITEYFAISDQYRRDMEASRKRITRVKQSTLKSVCEDIQKSHDTANCSYREIYELIVEQYNKNNMFLPSRSILETCIVNMGDAFKRQEYYLKNIV